MELFYGMLVGVFLSLFEKFYGIVDDRLCYEFFYYVEFFFGE